MYAWKNRNARPQTRWHMRRLRISSRWTIARTGHTTQEKKTAPTQKKKNALATRGVRSAWRSTRIDGPGLWCPYPSPVQYILKTSAMLPIEALLPHRAPMILLDAIRAWDRDHIECYVTLTEGSPFVVAGRVRSTIGVEYMAQCAAAWVGLQALARKEPVRVGYLIGARAVSFAADHFSVGDELCVEATRVWGQDALALFECAVRRGEETLVAGTLNFYRGAVTADVG
jgi:predicted hotdog family 3-hydroxylacyl-ACP dehydratase